MKFFQSDRTHLKICGITKQSEAEQLVAIGVDALGFNFWPHSKRHIPPETTWIKDISNEIWKIGVFVNQEVTLARRMFDNGWINAIQLHGDEPPETIDFFRNLEIPVIKALGIKDLQDIGKAETFHANAILLDTHAPLVFGGTGRTFDWNLAQIFQQRNPETPLILAGGIKPENALSAIQTLKPFMIDVASGAEISPGLKDFDKVNQLLAACKSKP